MRKSYFAGILILLSANICFAQSTFTSTQVGNWNDGGTWGNASPGVEGTDWPSSTDDVIILHNVSLTADRIINVTDIQSGGTLTMGSRKFTVNGSLNCDGSITGTNDLIFNGSSLNGTGTIALSGKAFKAKVDLVIESGADLTISDNFKIDAGDIDVTNNGTVTVIGDLTKNNGGNIWTNAANSVVNVGGTFMDDDQIEASASPNTINFNGSGNQNVFRPLTSYHHVQFTVGGIKTLQQDTDINGDVTITTAEFDANNRNLTIGGNWTNDGIFTQGNGTVTFDGTSVVGGSSTTTFPNLTITGTLTGHSTAMNVEGNWADNGNYVNNSGMVTFNGTTAMSGSATTNFCGVTISGILTGHPTNMNVACNWVNDGTFNNNSGKVTFNGTSTLSGTSTSSFYDVTITGTLTGVSAGNFNVAGDWDNSGGTFTNNSGMVTFNGTTPSIISNTGTGNFNNLTINNSTVSDAVTLNNAITVDGVLTLTDGYLVTTPTNLLTISTSGSVSGATDASYVQGPVAKNTNSTSTFTFPVGDNDTYRAIEVTPTTTNATTFTVRYYRANQGQGSGMSGIDHISSWEYWEMERSTGGSPAAADLTLTYDANSQVDNLTDLRIAQFDGSNWTSIGNDATTGTTITVNSVNDFDTKYFTLGSSTDTNPLSMHRYTVVATGNWSDASTWAYESGGTAGASVPSATQNAIIEGGADITLMAATFINDLEVKTGNTVSGAAFKLTVNGDLIVDGSITGTADLDYFGSSLSGSGSITLTGKAFKVKADMTIESGSSLTISDDFKIDVDDIDITNNGTLTVSGDLTKKNGGNIWTNATNSVVNVGGTFMDDDQIEASASPNTVNFNGSGNQNVFKPVSSYHHVQFTVGGIKTLQQDTDINGDVTITTADFKANNRNINVAGNWTNDGIFTQGTGTVTFDGTSIISGSSTTTFPNLTITGALTGHPTNMNVERDWVDNGTFINNSGTVTFNGTTTMSGSSTTPFCGVTISGTLTGHPTNMNVACNWINNGTFNNNSGTVTFNGTTTLSGSSTTSFFGVTVTGALTGVSAGNFNVEGDWNNNAGTFTNNSGTVTFNGTIASTISNTGSGNFNNLTINNSTVSDAVTLNNAITVDGLLTLTDGYVVTTPSNLLTISTSGSVSGATDASYVQGPVAKNTNSTSTFVFPVGGNDTYRPIHITPTSTNATTFTGRYYRASQSLGLGLGAGLDHISSWEYWEMDRSGGTPADADVILTWDANSQVDNLTDLRIAQFDGSNWTDTGNDGTTGTAAAGTITVNAVSSFVTKNFTLGSATDNNPLSMDRYTVVASGNWSDASTWAYESGGTPGASVPSATQNAVIELGATITLTGGTSINDLEIKTGNAVIDDGNKLTVNGDLIVDGSIDGTADMDYFGTSLAGSGTITLVNKTFKIKTDIAIESGSDITISNEFKMDVNGIDVTNNGTVTISGDITFKDVGNVWTNAANSVLNVGGDFLAKIEASANQNTVNFNGTGPQNVITSESGSYHNLQLTGSGIKTLQGATDFNGDVTITTAEFDVNDFDITVGGNWTNNGTFTSGIGTVTFDGIIVAYGGSATTTFYNLICNTTGGITMSAPAIVTTALTLTNGTVVTDATNILTLNSGGTLTGGSAASYVDGPMKKFGDTDFSFPLGDGVYWAPLDVVSIAGGSAATELIAEYFDAAAPNPGDLPASGITHVSGEEYWALDNGTTDITSADITLYWKDAERSVITDLTTGASQDLIIAHYNSGTPEWEPLTTTINGGSTVGPGGTGSVTATTTTFSPFSFASVLGNNPLPVELIFFNGQVDDKIVRLIWETASEENFDFFTIERSEDAIKFSELGIIQGKGTTSSVSKYSFVDERPLSGINYYRLKQTDYDGTFEYSNTISVQVSSVNDPLKLGFVIYPNPLNNDLLKVSFPIVEPEEEITIMLQDLNGKILEVMNRKLPLNKTLEFSIPQTLKGGTYIITVKNDLRSNYRRLILLR